MQPVVGCHAIVFLKLIFEQVGRIVFSPELLALIGHGNLADFFESICALISFFKGWIHGRVMSPQVATFSRLPFSHCVVQMFAPKMTFRGYVASVGLLVIVIIHSLVLREKVEAFYPFDG